MTQDRKTNVTPMRTFELIKDTSRLMGTAYGYAMQKPSISFTLETKTPMGRTRTEIVGFTSEEFDALYEFLTEAKKHWEEG